MTPPEKNTLFRSDEPDWWNNAYLNVGNDEFYRYAEGYKRAADILVRHINQNNRDQDFVSFPILFLYRQYLELVLKNIIQKGRQLLDEEGSYPPHHKIDQLWHLCKSIIIKIWPEGDTEDLALTEQCILSFSQNDPKSLSFRYPEIKSGESSLQDLGYVNLRHVQDMMSQISALLDGLNVGIGMYLEHNQEMVKSHEDLY